jgi:hypothetical protein
LEALDSFALLTLHFYGVVKSHGRVEHIGTDEDRERALQILDSRRAAGID